MHLGLALDLVERLPEVGEALRQGRIDLARARVICDGTGHLEESEARRVADAVLEQAENLTTGQLGARVRRLALSVQPDDAARRYEAAVEERRVMCLPNADGTADLVACNLPAERAVACMRTLDAEAHAAKRAGDPRSIDQLRTDLSWTASIQDRPPRGVAGWSTSTSISPPWPGSTPTRARSPGSGRSSPMSPAGWQPASTTRSGGSPSPIRRAGWLPGTGPPVADPTVTQRRYLEARNRTLCVPRVPDAGDRLGHRSHQGLRQGRINRRHQPRTAVPSPSSVEARGGVEAGTTRARSLPMDQSTRTRLHRRARDRREFATRVAAA